MMIARGYLLRGRVQGVGFRWWAAREARRLGLRGTVHNRPDGAVELYASGPETALLALESLLRLGPPAAVVEEIAPLPAPHDLPGEFRILP